MADQGFLKRIYFAVGSNKNTVKWKMRLS